MGCWSIPLFVNPSGLICDKSNIDSKLLEKYFSHCELDTDEKNNSVDYTHMKITDCSKIYGYFCPLEIKFWKTYLEQIRKQNNDIVNIEFHLFCLDENMPYIIGLFDGEFKIVIAEQGNPRWTSVENPNQILSDDEEYPEETSQIFDNFDKEKYIEYIKGLGKAHMKKVKFNFMNVIKGTKWFNY
jgi:hypothetical protein